MNDAPNHEPAAEPATEPPQPSHSTAVDPSRVPLPKRGDPLPEGTARANDWTDPKLCCVRIREGPMTAEDAAAAAVVNAEQKKSGRHNPARFKRMERLYRIVAEVGADPVACGLAPTPGQQGLRELDGLLFPAISPRDRQQQVDRGEIDWTEREVAVTRWAIECKSKAQPPSRSQSQAPADSTAAVPLTAASPTLPPGDWLMPPLTLGTIARRLGPTYGDDNTKTLLRPFGLRTFINRQLWTVRLDGDMPKSLRRTLETPHADEKR